MTLTLRPKTKATASEMLGPMLRSFLEDSLRVKVHKEARETSVYTLTAAEANPALRHAKDGDCVPTDLFQESLQRSAPLAPFDPSAPKRCGQMRGTRNVKWPRHGLDAYGITMAELAGRILSPYGPAPVIDKTGLGGRFDIPPGFVHRCQMGR